MDAAIGPNVGVWSTLGAAAAWVQSPAYFTADFTKATLTGTGTGTSVFARASAATVEDFEGNVRDCNVDEARFAGARRIANELDDSVDPSSWTAFNGATYVSGNTFDFPGVSETEVIRIVGHPDNNDAEFTQGVTLRAARPEDVGTVLALRIHGNGPNYPISDVVPITLTADYRRYAGATFSFAGEGVTNGVRFLVRNVDPPSAFQVDILDPQLEDVTVQSNQIPSEYISIGDNVDRGCGVDGVKYCDYSNGNTVDPVTHEITEAEGDPIPDIGYLNEDNSINTCVDSEDMTQLPSAAVTCEATTDVNLAGRPTFKVINGTAAGAYITLRGNEAHSNKICVRFLIENGNLDHPMRLNVYNGTTGNGNNIQLDLETGEIVSASEVTLTYERIEMIPKGNAWLVEIIGVPNTQTDLYRILYGNNSTDITDITYVAMPQVEDANTLSSHIPTSGSAATRDADNLHYTGVAVNSDMVVACDTMPLVQVDSNYTSEGHFSTDDARGSNYEVRSLWGISNGFVNGTGTRFFRVSRDDSEYLVRDKYLFSQIQNGANVNSAIYRNGEEEGTGSAARTLDHSNADIYALGRRHSGGQVFPCVYYGIQIFDYELDASQMAWLSTPGNK